MNIKFDLQDIKQLGRMLILLISCTAQKIIDAVKCVIAGKKHENEG